MNILKRWQFWLGLVISLVFLTLALRNLHLPLVWQTVKQAAYIWIFARCGSVLSRRVGACLALALPLAPAQVHPHTHHVSIVAIGYMGNNIYPARAGEVLRAAVLKQREGVPSLASLATIIVERIYDGVVMLAFVFLNLPELARLTHGSGVIGALSIRDVALWGTAIFVGALLAFLLAAMFSQTRRTADHLAGQPPAPPASACTRA